MPKVCHSCGKGPAFGHSRSHSMVATKRRFEPNLQKVRIDDRGTPRRVRSEEHTSELQSRSDLVCRLLLEKKKKKSRHTIDNDPAADNQLTPIDHRSHPHDD